MRNQRSHLQVVAVALAAVGAASACQAARRPAAPRPDTPAVVIFENRSLYDASVYAFSQGGARVRVGTVSAGRTDTLTIRSDVTGGTGTVTFVARLLAHRGAPSTGPLTLLPGDRLAVTLPPQANILSVLPAGA